MPPPCAIETCKRRSRALCHCCDKNLCPDHLKEHDDSINSQINPLVDQLNTAADQLLKIDVNDVVKNCRQKLDKWRDDSHKLIDRFYEEKCQELQQGCDERAEKYRKEIDRVKLKTSELIREQEATHEDIPTLKATINVIKRDVEQFEENGIIVDVRPLIIDQDLVYIEEWTSNEIDISTLPSPYRIIDCPKNDEPMPYRNDRFSFLNDRPFSSLSNGPMLISNDRFLLLNQNRNLSVFDRELTLVKEIPWESDRISDMCWSSTLNSFIILIDKNGLFMINENMTLIVPIQTIEKKQWLSCTCSDAALFLTTNEWGSHIFQFSLLSSFRLVKQLKPRESCETDEIINDIAYSKGKLAITITHKTKKTLKIEIRSSLTLDRIWSLPLDIKVTGGRMHRVVLSNAMNGL